MADEFDIIHLDQDDTQAIIDWAVSAAAMVILMDNAPRGENKDEELERLEGYTQAISIMWDNMPEILVNPAAIIAQESVDEAVEEEEQVEQFREQLKEL